jgi:hypothetical protein
MIIAAPRLRKCAASFRDWRRYDWTAVTAKGGLGVADDGCDGDPDGVYRGRIIIPGTKEWITVAIEGESEPTPVVGTIGAFPPRKDGAIVKCLDPSGPAVISAAMSTA